MQRAYSLLTVKSLDEDSRTITGIATTPKTDRMGDIVEPEGAEFTLPLPLLWQHRSDSPIGHVTKAKVMADGIEIVAQLARIDEPGELKNLLDKAWQAIRLKLVRGLSIGFQAIESTDIKGSMWAQRFVKWEWLELSAVTIPANVDASIATVKSYDEGRPAATGKAAPSNPPGVSGSVKIIPRTRGTTVKTYSERIADFENTRAAKVARRDEIQTNASDAGQSKDEAQREEFNTLTDEIKAIDRELADLRMLEAENANKAVAVTADDSEKAARSRGPSVVVKPEEKLDKGIEFARYAMCMAKAKGDVMTALNLAKTHYPNLGRVIGILKAAYERGATVEQLLMQQKDAVAAGTTTETTWALPLLAYNTFAGDFVEFLRPQTILGKFGAGGVPDLRRIPFNVHIKGQTSGGVGYWVGEGKPKPVTKYDFSDVHHAFAKVAAISVLTEELIRFSDPSAERLVRDALASTLVAKLDNDFIDPTKAVDGVISPASITNGVAAITSSGTDGDAVRADIAALWAAGIAANLPLTSAVYVTTPSIALALSLMTNALGQPEFPGFTMKGGTLLGVPTITSNYVPAGTFVLVYASEIYLSDDGNVTIDASREASIQMLDNPTNASDGGTVATAMVSMFQTNSVALRAERFINWSKRRATAVALLEEVSWGGTVGSS